METPDTGHESTLQVQVIAASVVMLALSTAAVALRLYTRRVVLGVLSADDCVILAALILSVGVTVGQIRQTFFGLGRHAWLVSEDEFIRYRLEEWYGFLLYATSLSCSKLSILLLYRRFLCLGWARICNNTVLALVTACSAWVFITSFIDCIPLQAVWDKTIAGKCLPMPVKIGNSYAHIITDFMIFFLPIPFVVGLRLGRRQKIGLLLVFSVGFVACLISIIRIVSLKSLPFDDFTYHLATLAIWGSVEVNLAIICACLTTLKPLIVRIFPRLLKSTYTETPRSLGYIGRGAGTGSAVSASRSRGTRVEVKLASGSFAKLYNTRSNDSEEGGGSYMVPPPKAYARLP